jgi:hypothetical protein
MIQVASSLPTRELACCLSAAFTAVICTVMKIAIALLVFGVESFDDANDYALLHIYLINARAHRSTAIDTKSH